MTTALALAFGCGYFAVLWNVLSRFARPYYAVPPRTPTVLDGPVTLNSTDHIGLVY